MNLFLEFILITLYMVVMYHIIALKYKKSAIFPKFSQKSKVLLVALHFFIVISNIFLYFWFISRNYKPVSFPVSASGIIIFFIGISVILSGIYTLKKVVFVPGNRLILAGLYRYVRHPMYLGGIIGAFGLAVFAGSLPGVLYSIILALVLSHIADAEEEDLIARFGQEYIEYRKKVPKLFPYAW